MAENGVTSKATWLDANRLYIEVTIPPKASDGEQANTADRGSLYRWRIVLTVFTLFGLLVGLKSGYHLGFSDASRVGSVAQEAPAAMSAVLASHTTTAQPIPDRTLANMTKLALQKTRDCLNYLGECKSSIVNLLDRGKDDWRISASYPEPRWLAGLDVGDALRRYRKKADDARVGLEVVALRRSFVVNVEVPAYTCLRSSPGDMALESNYGCPERNLEMIPPVVREEIVAYFAQNIFCALGECYAEEMATYNFQINFKTVLVWNEQAVLDEGGNPLVIGQWSGRIPASAAPRSWYGWRTIGPSQFRTLIEFEV